MEYLINLIRSKFLKENALRIAVILGIAAIGLILLSEFLPQKSTAKSAAQTDSAIDTESFRLDTEQKLSEILSKINGVGKVEVMLTVSGTEEYVYAEEVKQSSSNESEKTSAQRENSFVLLDSGGEKEALVKKIISPQINGVVIVCEGGGSARVCESIYRSVSTVLGIPTNKIYVTQIKSAE